MKTRNIYAHLLSLAINRVMYFDRVNIWLNTNRPLINESLQETLKESGLNIEIILKPMSPFQPTWKQLLQLHQPSLLALRYIAEAIQNAACSYLINRVELAVDWITESRENADTLHRFLQESFIHKAGQRYFFENSHSSFKRRGTSYFALKDTHHILPLIYSDRSSKLTGQPCAHFEYRLLNTESCRSKGIVTLSQLIHYDILHFFRNNVHFHKKVSKLQVGQAIAAVESRNIASRRGYEKLCDAFLDEHQLSYDMAGMQQLLQCAPALRKELETKNSYQDIIMKALFR
jgi:hypothetical protein